ncbi:hypothetical protein RIF29_16040 [Crotalaria pallida]|uniref:Uncharacterized protein n=1 Tax=Crotalaria pallida TaxID=3830 RepID=A0AAN9FMZ4_CROPI
MEESLVQSFGSLESPATDEEGGSEQEESISDFSSEDSDMQRFKDLQTEFSSDWVPDSLEDETPCMGKEVEDEEGNETKENIPHEVNASNHDEEGESLGSVKEYGDHCRIKEKNDEEYLETVIVSGGCLNSGTAECYGMGKGIENHHGLIDSRIPPQELDFEPSYLGLVGDKDANLAQLVVEVSLDKKLTRKEKNTGNWATSFPCYAFGIIKCWLYKDQL